MGVQSQPRHYTRENRMAANQASAKQPRIHVLYYETGIDDGQGLPGVMLLGRGAPTLCPNGALLDPWKCRLDNMQVCLRMCCREGSGFRRDTCDFVCMSQRLCIQYDLKRFYSWTNDRGTKVPSESTVIGTAIRVAQGNLTPADCGVSVEDFSNSSGQEVPGWIQWLQKYVLEIRQVAESNAGVGLGCVLDQDGQTIGVCGAEKTSVDRVKDIIFVLGGPDGIPDEERQIIYQIFNNAREGMHRTVTASVPSNYPGGPLHSYMALAGAFLEHDRGRLLPSLLKRAVPNAKPLPMDEPLSVQLEISRKAGNQATPNRGILDLSDKDLTDEDLVRFSLWLNTRLQSFWISDLQLNLKGNRFGCSSTRSLTCCLALHSMSVSKLDLRHNNIGDSGATAVAMLCSLERPPSQVLLDNNNISFNGASTLINAALANEAYPRKDSNDGKRVPLWLTLHKNDMAKEDEDKVLQQVSTKNFIPEFRRSEDKNWSALQCICIPSAEESCSVEKCRRQRGWDPTAVVHLPYFGSNAPPVPEQETTDGRPAGASAWDISSCREDATENGTSLSSSSSSSKAAPSVPAHSVPSQATCVLPPMAQYDQGVQGAQYDQGTMSPAQGMHVVTPYVVQPTQGVSYVQGQVHYGQGVQGQACIFLPQGMPAGQMMMPQGVQWVQMPQEGTPTGVQLPITPVHATMGRPQGDWTPKQGDWSPMSSLLASQGGSPKVQRWADLLEDEGEEETGWNQQQYGGQPKPSWNDGSADESANGAEIPSAGAVTPTAGSGAGGSVAAGIPAENWPKLHTAKTVPPPKALPRGKGSPSSAAAEDPSMIQRTPLSLECALSALPPNASPGNEEVSTPRSKPSEQPLEHMVEVRLQDCIEPYSEASSSTLSKAAVLKTNQKPINSLDSLDETPPMAIQQLDGYGEEIPGAEDNEQPREEQGANPAKDTEKPVKKTAFAPLPEIPAFKGPKTSSGVSRDLITVMNLELPSNLGRKAEEGTYIEGKKEKKKKKKKKREEEEDEDDVAKQKPSEENLAEYGKSSSSKDDQQINDAPCVDTLLPEEVDQFHKLAASEAEDLEVNHNESGLLSSKQIPEICPPEAAAKNEHHRAHTSSPVLTEVPVPEQKQQKSFDLIAAVAESKQQKSGAVVVPTVVPATPAVVKASPGHSSPSEGSVEQPQEWGTSGIITTEQRRQGPPGSVKKGPVSPSSAGPAPLPVGLVSRTQPSTQPEVTTAETKTTEEKTTEANATEAEASEASTGRAMAIGTSQDASSKSAPSKPKKSNPLPEIPPFKGVPSNKSTEVDEDAPTLFSALALDRPTTRNSTEREEDDDSTPRGTKKTKRDEESDTGDNQGQEDLKDNFPSLSEVKGGISKKKVKKVKSKRVTILDETEPSEQPKEAADS